MHVQQIRFRIIIQSQQTSSNQGERGISLYFTSVTHNGAMQTWSAVLKWLKVSVRVSNQLHVDWPL